MREIKPGLFHWTRRHPRIGADVSSYWLRDERVLLNPMEPDGELDPAPTDVLMTNRHHWRDIPRIIERYGVTVHGPETGARDLADRPVELFGARAELPGGGRAHFVGAISPDETAIHFPAHGALAVADGVVSMGNAPVEWVPDMLMGENPDEVKAGLKVAFARLLDEVEFDTLLLAHGDPLVGDGKQRLEEFVRG